MNTQLHDAGAGPSRGAQFRRMLLCVACFLIVGTILVLGIRAAEQSPKNSDEEVWAAKQAAAGKAAVRWTAIKDEVKKLGNHEWAGEYYYGDGLGVNVSFAIAPTSGYAFEWHGCLGCYDRNFGAVEFKDGRIRLAFTFENKRKGFQGIAPEFIPVAWGPRRYLIPADDVIGFCNGINHGMESRLGSRRYLLRQGDEEKKVDGFPKVPDEYKGYLLDKPINATIVAVGEPKLRPSLGDWKFKDVPVTLNMGKEQGLMVGMELLVAEPERSFDSVRVTKVEETRAEGVVTQIGEDWPAPKAGWKLSTHSKWSEQPEK
jgi:hypothetical protein